MSNVVMFRRVHVVYLVTNRVSGKLYVGRTGQGLKKRWRQHVHDAFVVTPKRKYRCPLHEAIAKHGADAFDVSVLATFATEEESCVAETEAIARLRTTDSSIGYNASTGGEGSNGFVMRESHKESIRRALKGKPQSEELKSKRAASKIGCSVSEYVERLARGEKHCSGAKLRAPHWLPRAGFTAKSNYCRECARASSRLHKQLRRAA